VDKEQRNRLQKATQEARRLLEEEFRSQLLQTYDIDVDRVRWAEEPGAHLQAEQRLIREKLLAWIEHKEGQIHDRKEALFLAMREMAFTVLNRFVALKLMEARELVRPCVSGGLESAGFQEFTAVAEGLLADQEGSYRLYLETIFEDVSRDVRVLFDPRDVAAALWPRRTALLDLLSILNRPELAELWGVDESIGWVYQYFNSKEERQEMRKSAAPRNSRELAVRNQFFTPRYVVEFLTDNTLGRIWYEMNKGETRLAEQCRYLVRRPTEIFLAEGETLPETPEQEGLSQEELLQQSVPIPHRPIKDPREIRLLDPACGSMHFGLYAFDLFETIYEEAWDQGSCPALQEDYASKEEFLKDVPRLIVEHNIHGIDIDPRAVQIAGLTLWLRAQKAWQSRGVNPADRPRIVRSNVVCAEPMPGSPEMLEEFVATLDSPLLGELVKTVFEKMQLAGEAGSLLKIEEDIRSAIDAARAEWLKSQYNLFTREEGSQDEFFETAEHQIIDALRAYAEMTDAASYERRLFTDDAARGFAFIELCRKRYDTVVMNPPFGEASRGFGLPLKHLHPTSQGNLYPAFILSGRDFTIPSGLVGAITADTYAVLSSFSAFRRDLLASEKSFHFAVDLGWDVLDSAQVSTMACVFGPALIDRGVVFVDLTEADTCNKESELSAALDSLNRGRLLRAFLPTRKELFSLPDYMLSYKLAPSVLRAYREGTVCGGRLFEAFTGVSPSGSERYLRTWWEVPAYSLRDTWLPLAHGGGIHHTIGPYTWSFSGQTMAIKLNKRS